MKTHTTRSDVEAQDLHDWSRRFPQHPFESNWAWFYAGRKD